MKPENKILSIRSTVYPKNECKDFNDWIAHVKREREQIDKQLLAKMQSELTADHLLMVGNKLS